MINMVIIDQLTTAYGISELHAAIFIAHRLLMADCAPPTFDKKVSGVSFLFNERYRSIPVTELHYLGVCLLTYCGQSNILS